MDYSLVSLLNVLDDVADTLTQWLEHAAMNEYEVVELLSRVQNIRDALIPREQEETGPKPGPNRS